MASSIKPVKGKGGPTPRGVKSEIAKLDSAGKRARLALKSASLRHLLKSMKGFRPDKKINPTGMAEILDIRASKTKNPYLIVHAQVRGTKVWTQNIHFPSLVLSGTPMGVYNLPVQVGPHAKDQQFFKAMTVDDPILVRCTCPDYQHTFSWQNFDVKSHQGRRIQYQKVAGSNRPPRNPDNVQGVCKHIRAVVHKLQDPRGPFPIMQHFSGSFTTSQRGYTGPK